MTFATSPVIGDRVAVIDIGSRSLQLVIYDHFGPAPILLHSEKVVAFLGKNLTETGVLHQEGMEIANFNLSRFVSLVRDLNVSYCAIIATQALREAKNGKEYIRFIENLCEAKVQILKGEEEAINSARSIQWAFLNPQGVMGDLGGGSLELVRFDKGEPQEKISLPIGPLRIESLFQESISKAQKFLEEAYRNITWIKKPKSLYLVGGGWRTLANYHMQKTNYPIPISQGYHLSPHTTSRLCSKIIKANPEELASWSRATAGRKLTLPMSALVLKELLKVTQPQQVVFTSYGLREGYLMNQLPPEYQKEDPFLWAAKEWNKRSSRLPGFAEALYKWLDPLIGEDQALRRLTYGACLLSDVVWRDHHNFQAEIMFERALSLPFVTLTHDNRALLAFILYLRYGGKLDRLSLPKVLTLLTKDELKWGRIIGSAMYLAYTLSAGSHEILNGTKLLVDDEELRLVSNSDPRLFEGYEVQKRFQKLAVLVKARGST
ncbi:Ppx/GppA family phosphatase [Candidatus Bealeia paramacronuclearis]|uniref:Ppx/GppA family phosphatase n=1 Tax=Candidatus Bealeia paramacronuclearis TaxID=1921001 RepID=A0ABZ2C6N0_9PROT|nr:Ppx/GppA family phosphatase [Candidatus Bealeia paramacronuclearis]